MATSTPTQPEQQSHFLHLPREIRNEIYKYHTNNALAFKVTPKDAESTQEYVLTGMRQPALAYTCKQVYHEYRQEQWSYREQLGVSMERARAAVNSSPVETFVSNSSAVVVDPWRTNPYTLRLYVDLRNLPPAIEKEITTCTHNGPRSRRRPSHVAHYKSLLHYYLKNIANAMHFAAVYEQRVERVQIWFAISMPGGRFDSVPLKAVMRTEYGALWEGLRGLYAPNGEFGRGIEVLFRFCEEGWGEITRRKEAPGFEFEKGVELFNL
jgi:hypothetical protein